MNNGLDREEVEKVLLSMGISSASELANILVRRRMDFDGFCNDRAGDGAEVSGEARRGASATMPTKRKVPRQKLTGRFVTTDSVDFSGAAGRRARACPKHLAYHRAACNAAVAQGRPRDPWRAPLPGTGTRREAAALNGKEPRRRGKHARGLRRVPAGRPRWKTQRSG